MSKTSSVRSKHLSSSSASASTITSKSRYLRPVPYATTLALEQFFDGGSMDEHIARRTTSSAKPSKPSPLSPHHHQSRRQSRHPGSTTKQQQQQQQQQQHPRKSEHHESSKNDKRRTQQFTPVLTTTEREIGKGASLPVVDEKGHVWYDWEEKQEFAPLITVEHERSGWVNFPGATTGRRGSMSSTSDDGEGSDGGEGLPSPIRLPLHSVLDAFTFQPAAAGGGAGVGAGAATVVAAVDPKDKAPLPGLQVPPGTRPRGKDRRVVRRADSLPALDHAKAAKDAAAREFLDASFDPVKAMLVIQHQQQQHPPGVVVVVAPADASGADNKLAAFGKRPGMSMKGLKKIFSRKKSTSA